MLISDTTNTKHYFSWSKPEPGVIDPSSQAIFPTNHLHLPPMITCGLRILCTASLPSHACGCYRVRRTWSIDGGRGGSETYGVTAAHTGWGSSTHREHRSRYGDVQTIVEFCFSVFQKNVCYSLLRYSPFCFPNSHCFQSSPFIRCHCYLFFSTRFIHCMSHPIPQIETKQLYWF